MTFNSAAAATQSATSAASYLTITGYQGGINTSNSIQLNLTALGNLIAGTYTGTDTTHLAAIAYTQFVTITTLSDTAVSGTFSGQDTTSLQDLKQDEIRTGFVVLDKAINDMSTDASVTKERTDGYCWGDCCGACLELKDKSNGNRLFLIKSNCGEGGYSNHQYYFEHNELKIARDFAYTVEDATSTLTEKVYFLEENTALCKQRQITSKEPIEAFTGQRFKTKSMQLLSTNKSKMRDLKDLLNMQNYHYSPE
ncbi:hypothetical protein F5148DRAFT_1150338 [Russula earlei]|uniref:Uncharacterized protein n=1 Tax=Russula earlei TaxID=71964 RepID=A0ACC0U6G5_9AGAM|nr:hypothetical protein F5148DRAFT_1150338 [Russula earlei]